MCLEHVFFFLWQTLSAIYVCLNRYVYFKIIIFRFDPNVDLLLHHLQQQHLHHQSQVSKFLKTSRSIFCSIKTHMNIAKKIIYYMARPLRPQPSSLVATKKKTPCKIMIRNHNSARRLLIFLEGTFNFLISQIKLSKKKLLKTQQLFLF